MPWFDDAAELTLQPRMSFRISGGPNGYSFGPTVFAQGVISGMGQPFDEAKINSGAEGLSVLESIGRRQDLVKAFKDGPPPSPPGKWPGNSSASAGRWRPRSSSKPSSTC